VFNVDGLFALFGIIWIGGLVLMIWALVDAIRVPDDSMYRAGTKLVWVLVILLASFIGAIIYFAVGRPARGVLPRPHSDLPPPPPRPV
jgi:membrane protein DedA with SNARE-associated domain